MSIEIFVLSDRQVGSIAEWQKPIDAEGFPLRLSEKRPFDALSGHLPAELGGRDAGFECDHLDATELMAHYSAIDFGHPWTFVLAFRIGPNFNALLGAHIAAMAYARATGGGSSMKLRASRIRRTRRWNLSAELNETFPGSSSP
jgi:hypothetical protein